MTLPKGSLTFAVINSPPTLYGFAFSTQKDIDDEFTGVTERPTTDYDTHPSPRDRFRYVSSIRPSEAEHLHGEVWDLFADRTAITTEMSNLIEELVRSTYDNSEGSTLGL